MEGPQNLYETICYWIALGSLLVLGLILIYVQILVRWIDYRNYKEREELAKRQLQLPFEDDMSKDDD